jgi:hypothetical protein
MPNHVHIIAVPGDEDGLRRTFRYVHPITVPLSQIQKIGETSARRAGGEPLGQSPDRRPAAGRNADQLEGDPDLQAGRSAAAVGADRAGAPAGGSRGTLILLVGSIAADGPIRLPEIVSDASLPLRVSLEIV